MYWIPTPRGNGAPIPREPGYLTGIGENLLALHGTEMPHALAQQFIELNTYNREFARLSGKHAFEQLDSLLPTLGSVDSRADRAGLQRSTRSTARPTRSRSTTSGIPTGCSAGSATRRLAWRCCS